MTTYTDSIEGSAVPSVPEGTYLAQLEGVEPAKTRFGDALKWHWKLPSAGDFELTQLTSTATTGGSNAGKNIRALRGRGLPPGERLPMSEIVGKSVTLVLSVDDESGWNRVEEVHPVAAQLPAAAVADVAEHPLGSAAHFQQRMARQQAEAQAATFPTTDELPF